MSADNETHHFVGRSNYIIQITMKSVALLCVVFACVVFGYGVPSYGGYDHTKCQVLSEDEDPAHSTVVGTYQTTIKKVQDLYNCACMCLEFKADDPMQSACEFYVFVTKPGIFEAPQAGITPAKIIAPNDCLLFTGSDASSSNVYQDSDTLMEVPRVATGVPIPACTKNCCKNPMAASANAFQSFYAGKGFPQASFNSAYSSYANGGAGGSSQKPAGRY